MSCEAEERSKLEKLCRYITRPALANERITINDQGQVILKLKSAWSDGTSHLVMSAQEFMQRLAALVPRPRLHLTRYHGVLAPNAKWRSLIVPDLAVEEPDTELQSANVQADVQSDTNADEGKPLRAKRYSWAKLLQRVFAIDMAHCPHCGANLRIIAAIVEQGVTNKILAHLAKQEERDQANQGSQSMARAPPVAGKASGYQQWLI